MNFLLKQNFKSFFSSKNKIYQSNDSFVESVNLKETIFPQYYFEALKASLEYANPKKAYAERVKARRGDIFAGEELRALKKRLESENFPSLDEVLSYAEKNNLDRKTVDHWLNHLAKGKTSITEDLDGKLEFIKFSNFKNSNKNLKLNALNLKQIPIYTIVNKKGNILGFKDLKNSKDIKLNNNIFGFFDYEDAVNHLYELQPKLNFSMSNYGLTKSTYLDYRVEKFSFETFYKMWVLGQRNVTLVPSFQNMGNTVYITKSPYSKIGGKEVYLTSFSKSRLTEILKKARLKNKKIVQIETDEFFNQTLNRDLSVAYFFISHEIQEDKTLVSGKNLASAQADFNHFLETDEPDIKIGMFAPLRTLTRKIEIEGESEYQRRRFRRPYWYRLFTWYRKLPKKVMRLGILGSKYKNSEELIGSRLNYRPFYKRTIQQQTVKSFQQRWLDLNSKRLSRTAWWELSKEPKKPRFTATKRWDMLHTAKSNITNTRQQIFSNSRDKKRQISSLKFWRYRKLLLAPKQVTSNSFIKQKPKNFANTVENQLTNKISYLTLEDFLAAKYKAENLLPKNKS